MHLAADVYMDFQCKKNKIAALISPNELEWYLAPSPGEEISWICQVPPRFLTQWYDGQTEEVGIVDK